MSLSPRSGSPNHLALSMRLFACLIIFVLLTTQFVIPGKAVSFSAARPRAENRLSDTDFF